MSYILDALRRANSERERGTVPTLHANPGPADLAADDDEEVEHRDPARAGASSRPTWPLAVGAGVVLAALAAFLFWPRTPEPVVLASAPAPQPPQQAAPQPAPQPSPQLPPTVATVPLSVPPLQQAQAPAAPPPPPQAVPAPAPVPAPQAAPAPQHVPTQAELPEALRRQLPPLKTGGAMYSDTPANRMLILNGQVLHEGEKLSPDLVLEEIGLKTAVLVFKGQRFTINY
ncbi:general secretion pathway protein GspB [Paucibacter sp. R3-3]|uniref:General secretion pathway protein GspB n=1 Tax=Roseateles agri TaxID=3098619 RepID=A0ABU5DPP0_9BURK|nr:general secretion pathway protein GspB [Paucibacter sp. R3-3]MDY0748286.1 general secretion pathway protein GspB [Paucibacter sp. R3-3]